MFFQNPSFLWGLLTVAVPIALHFWHQQQAKPMPWAMLRWLELPNQPPKRGFRFDNWLLLLLRCLLLIALTLLLAGPSLPEKTKQTAGPTVHLVAPDPTVVQANRFELEQALTRQERVVWATSPLTPVTTLTDVPSAPAPNPLQWQSAITALNQPAVRLHTYLTNSPAWTDAPSVYVPTNFTLHQTDAPVQSAGGYIALPANRQLVVGTNRRLQVTASGTSAGKAVATAPLRVLTQFRQPDERRTVQAALNALSSVYNLPLQLDNQPVQGITYAWVLTDQPVPSPQPGTLYTLTGQLGDADQPNVTYVPEHLVAPGSERVATGQLPEWLADQLITYLGLSAPSALTYTQLAALFVPGSAVENEPAGVRPANPLQAIFLLFFLSLLLAERILAPRRQA